MALSDETPSSAMMPVVNRLAPWLLALGLGCGEEVHTDLVEPAPTVDPYPGPWQAKLGACSLPNGDNAGFVCADVAEVVLAADGAEYELVWIDLDDAETNHRCTRTNEVVEPAFFPVAEDVPFAAWSLDCGQRTLKGAVVDVTFHAKIADESGVWSMVGHQTFEAGHLCEMWFASLGP